MSKPKKPSAAPVSRGIVYNLRLGTDRDAAIEAFREAQLVQPDKSAIITKAIDEFLEKHGFWPPKAPPKGKE